MSSLSPMRITSVRRLVVALCAALLVATQLAAATTSNYVERLPRVKAGKLLPSAAGLVLGKTTKRQLLARWGPATQCSDIVRSCSWVVGTRQDGSRRAGVTSDSIIVAFHRLTGWATGVSLRTSSAHASRLRAWKLPGGIGIGTGFPAVRRTFPTVRWTGSSAVDTSEWGVPSYVHQGTNYAIQFTVDRATKSVSSGRLIAVGVSWLPPLLTCRLEVATVPPPDGAVAGRRIRGSCSGASIYAANWGRPAPLRVRFVASPGYVTSTSSPFDSECGRDACLARSTDWAIDATVGLSTAEARLEARVGPPPTSTQVLRVPLG
jgi:hypothetical protein